MAARLSSGAMYNEFCLLIFFVQRVVCVCVHVCVWRFFSELVVAWGLGPARWAGVFVNGGCALADTNHSQSKMNRNTRSRSRERSVTGCRCHRTCAGQAHSAVCVRPGRHHHAPDQRHPSRDAHEPRTARAEVRAAQHKHTTTRGRAHARPCANSLSRDCTLERISQSNVSKSNLSEHAPWGHDHTRDARPVQPRRTAAGRRRCSLAPKL
jgi:hypothetical protein